MNNSYLKVGLSFGTAGAIVRCTAQHEIHSVIGSWTRTRNGSVDKVFTTTPSALKGPMGELVGVTSLEGKNQKSRYDFIVHEDEEVSAMFAGLSGPGYWAVLLMNRVGQLPDRQVTKYRLDHRWKAMVESGETIPDLAKSLHCDFFEVANTMPSAWGILWSSAEIFGGQKNLYARSGMAPPVVSQDLASAITAERNFRDAVRKLRRMSPDQLKRIRSTMSQQQLSIVDAMLSSERS